MEIYEKYEEKYNALIQKNDESPMMNLRLEENMNLFLNDLEKKYQDPLLNTFVYERIRSFFNNYWSNKEFVFKEMEQFYSLAIRLATDIKQDPPF